MCGILSPHKAAILLLLDKCTSIKFLCFPFTFANGFNDLTTPAPFVHRLPAPPAKDTIASSPFFRDFKPVL